MKSTARQREGHPQVMQVTGGVYGPEGAGCSSQEAFNKLADQDKAAHSGHSGVPLVAEAERIGNSREKTVTRSRAFFNFVSAFTERISPSGRKTAE